jgi:LCP family protein required for cell wall assembly
MSTPGGQRRDPYGPYRRRTPSGAAGNGGESGRDGQSGATQARQAYGRGTASPSTGRRPTPASSPQPSWQPDDAHTRAFDESDTHRATLPPQLNPRGPGGGGPGNGGRGGGGRGRRPAGSGRGRTVALGAFALISLLVLGTSGVGWALAKKANDSIGRVDGALSDGGAAKADSADQTFLVVGVDDRAGVPHALLSQYHALGDACDCTDTMMLVHISPRQHKAIQVPIPRDTIVTFPQYVDKHTGRTVQAGTSGKINAAFQRGGPALTVQVVQQMTDVHIDHFVEVNFLSFVDTINALGGINVCVNQPVNDKAYTHLVLTAGWHKMNGGEALEYVRLRHGAGDGSDLDRTKRQQSFMADMLRQATSSNVLLNPIKLNDVLGSALSALKTDKDLTPPDLVNLAMGMKGIAGGNITFAQIPIDSETAQVPGGGGEGVVWDPAGAKALFSALVADRDPNTPKPAASTPSSSAPATTGVTKAPGDVSVRVYNGTNVPGLGQRASNELAQRGFAIAAPPGNRDQGRTSTLIQYDPRYNESVKTVQAALPGAQTQQVAGLGRTIVVIVGSSYSGTSAVQVSGGAATGGGTTATATAPKIATNTAASISTCGPPPS